MKKVSPISSMAPNKMAAMTPPQQTYRWISALLVVGHVAETALQIYLINHYWPVTTRWAAGLAALLTAAVAIINAASIIGVRRGLDFADRWFGQCLCYVMHLSLLGMVWRFLKLTFLYDRTDLREFALLRFVQVHLQTLPSLLLQTCLIYSHGLLNMEVTAVPIGLAIAQLVIGGVTIALTTLVLSMPTSGVLAAAPNPVKCIVDEEMMVPGFPTRRNRQQPTERGCSGHQCVITAVRSICLLWCRTVAVGVFMTEFHVWTLIVFGVHWCIALLWLVLQDSASELYPGLANGPPSPAVSLFRRALVAYLLVFDWPPRYQPKHSGWSASHKQVSPASVVPAVGSWLDVIGLGGEPRSVAVAVYYGISGVENAAMLALWFNFAPPSALVPPVARLTTLATCTAALTLGVLCVVASTQGPDDESVGSSSSNATLTTAHLASSAESTTSSSSSAASSISSGPAAVKAPFGCTVVQQREVRTVVAQVHPPATIARLTQAALTLANSQHSHPPLEPPPPPPPEATWERAISVCDDDDSSNSRNTNTLDGGLLSGSASCPSPPLYNAPMANLGSCPSPAVNMKTHPACRSSASPFRNPSTFTSSQKSYRPTPTDGLEKTVKRPYLPNCPLSSTPRLVRRDSSFGSSVAKPTRPSRVSKTNGATCGRPRRRKQHHGCKQRVKGVCHCRIFDDYGMGILIKENPVSKSGTLTVGQSSCGRLSHGLFENDGQPQLQIRCAKCLGAHDPLLTNCTRSKRSTGAVAKLSASAVVNKSRTLPTRIRASNGVALACHQLLDVSACSTNYPSDTEITCTRRSVTSSGAESGESSSLDSDATYTTWPPTMRIPSMERLLADSADPSPWDYVQAWLVNANQPHANSRTGRTQQASACNTAKRKSTARQVKRLGTATVPSVKELHQHQHQQQLQPSLHYVVHPHRHLHREHEHGGVQDVYSAYCTVPPRLGQTVNELSVVRRQRTKTSSAVAAQSEHQYSTPVEIVV